MCNGNLAKKDPHKVVAAAHVDSSQECISREAGESQAGFPRHSRCLIWDFLLIFARALGRTWTLDVADIVDRVLWQRVDELTRTVLCRYP